MLRDYAFGCKVPQLNTVLVTELDAAAMVREARGLPCTVTPFMEGCEYCRFRSFSRDHGTRDAQVAAYRAGTSPRQRIDVHTAEGTKCVHAVDC